MDSKVREYRKAVLDGIKTIFDNSGIANQYEELGEDIDVLATLHNDFGMSDVEVLGEYFFIDIPNAESQVNLLDVIFTISEEMKDEKIDVVSKAESALNFYMPIGMFTLSKRSHEVVYKCQIMIPASYTVEQAVALADLNIGMAMGLVDKYTDIFFNLAEGDMTFEQFEANLPDEYFAE